MLNRREALAVAAGTLMHGEATFAKAPQPGTPVSFNVPPNACDCHTHIFGDPARFPLWPGRTYTPEMALPEEMAALHRALHIDRVVIVTPSIYGTDNSTTVYGIKARGAQARGVAVIDEKTPENDLDVLDRAGIRGVRLNLATAGPTDRRAGRMQFRTAMDRIRKRGWHIQIYASLAVVAGIKDLMQDSAVPVVFDHFGGARAALGLAQPGFAELVELIRSGKAYVKISGAYRASTHTPDYADVAPLARALIAANADRILWGTDWPHPNAAKPPGSRPTDLTPLLQIDDGCLLNQLAVWAPKPAIRHKILVANPAELYRF